MSTSTHADAVVAALHEAVAATAQSVGSAGRGFTKAVQAVSQADDVILTLAAMVDLVVAADDLHDQADAAVKRVRAVLAAQLQETGATTIQGSHFSASLSRRPAFVSINDEAALPAEFIVQRTAPDKKAIASAIKDGIEVPGASLLTPNEPVLVLRARKETV
jgi:hypothetical protein